MSGADREHRYNSQQHGRGGISQEDLEALTKKPPVYDWEVFDKKGRHVSYLVWKTKDESEKAAQHVCFLCRREFGSLKIVGYPRGTRQALLLNKAISEERYGSAEKAARYRATLRRLDKTNQA